MRVLITGANGFVGKATCARFLAAGAAVRGAVRNAAAAAGLRDVEPVVIGDIGAETSWKGAIVGVDCVVHLAARVHRMRDDSQDPLAEHRAVNRYGVERLARDAAAAGVRCLVFVSTVKVLGDAREEPYTDGDAAAPVDAYGVSKWEGEQGAHGVARETGLEVVVLRPPLVYGPGVKANFLRLLRLVRAGCPLPFGAVKNRRSLLFVGNLADAIFAAATCQAARGETFLVSDREAVSTPELIRKMAAVLGVRPRLVPVPAAVLRTAAGVVRRRDAAERLLGSLAVDSRRFQQVASWAPPFTLDEGLAATAEWWLREQRA